MNTAFIIVIIVLIAGVVLSGAMWVVGAFSNNYIQSINGKKGFLITGGAGGCAIIVNFLYTEISSITSPSTFLFTISIAASLIALIFTVLVTLMIYREQRTKKQMSYQVLSRTSISINNDMKKLQILYEGNPLLNFEILLLKIWNSGNTAVLPKDYLEPIEISFEEEVLSVEVYETNPKDIEVSMSISDRHIIIEPLLLNSEDTIILEVYLTSLKKGENINFHTRIIETRIIAENELRRKRKNVDAMAKSI